MLPNYTFKRLRSLDAMRGMAILAMLPFHVLLYGGLALEEAGGEWGAKIPELSVVELEQPLGTGLLLFFFVTGMGLTISLARRSERQSPREIGRHVILRYGGYVLAGIFYENILQKILFGGGVNAEELVQGIISGTIFSGPIKCLGLTAILAFPLILYLSWGKLVATSLVLTPIVGVTLYYVLLPQASNLPTVLIPILTNGWGILKGLPIVLVGAALAKLVLQGKDVKKKNLTMGSVITAAYVLIPMLLGTGMLHILIAIWSYHHAVLFTLGTSFFIFGLFQLLETRNINLTPLTVLDRSSVFVFYGHFSLGIALYLLIGAENWSMMWLLFEMVVVTAIIWIFFYFYSKWRWGNPSTW